MSTSGTKGLVVFNTRKVVDHAYRACRLPAQVITAEMQQVAIEELDFMLSGWVNKQLPIWCQQKNILGLTEGVYTVDYFPTGSIDVLDANIRTTTRLTGNAGASSGVAGNAFDDSFATVCTLAGVVDQNISLTLTEAAIVTVAGFLPGSAGTWNYSFQYSVDGATWVTFASASAYAANDSEWLWVDAEGIPSVLYYRLLVATASLPVSIRELVFANNAQEINLARINKDDYFYLPDKHVRGRPVQFWLDRQRSGPVMMLWPSPATEYRYAQLTVLTARHIMDVGTLRQEIEVPQRWYDAVMYNLGKRLAIITPEVKPGVYQILKDEAGDALAAAFAEDRDKSPINIQPDISPYTA